MRLRLAVAGLLLAGAVHAADRNLIIISVDGLSWNTFAKHRAQLPTLDKLAGQGVALPLEPSFPTMTWSTHTTLVTGVQPRRHGVVGNRYYDRAAGELVQCWAISKEKLLRVPTLYDVAHARGLSTAAVLWPGTSQAPGLDWNIPEVYGQRVFEAGSSPGFLRELGEAGLPVEHIGRLGGEESFLLDSMVRDVSIHLIANHQPRLMLLHFLTLDTAAHAYGPDGREVGWALRLVDGLVGEVLAAYERAGLLPQTDVLITSDHGFVATDTALDVHKVLKQRNLSARLVVNGHVLFLYPDTKEATPSSLVKIADALAARPEIERVVKPQEFAALGLATPEEDPRMPDLIALARPNVLFENVSGPKTQLTGAPSRRGNHGYLPTHPELAAVFIAAGPGVTMLSGASLPPVRMIDVAPTAARMLGLTMPEPDGKVRVDLLRAVVTPAPAPTP